MEHGLDLARMIAFLLTMLCAAFGGVPNLIYFNWPGLGVAALFTALTYCFPGQSLWLAFIGVVFAWGFYIRAQAKESRLL